MLATREKQLHLWTQLVLGYCRHHRTFELQLAANASPLWANGEIRRQLTAEGLRAVAEHLVAAAAAEWVEPGRGSIIVLWKTVAEWGDSIRQWVR